MLRLGVLSLGRLWLRALRRLMLLGGLRRLVLLRCGAGGVLQVHTISTGLAWLAVLRRLTGLTVLRRLAGLAGLGVGAWVAVATLRRLPRVGLLRYVGTRLWVPVTSLRRLWVAVRRLGRLWVPVTGPRLLRVAVRRLGLALLPLWGGAGRVLAVRRGRLTLLSVRLLRIGLLGLWLALSRLHMGRRRLARLHVCRRRLAGLRLRGVSSLIVRRKGRQHPLARLRLNALAASCPRLTTTWRSHPVALRLSLWFGLGHLWSDGLWGDS